MTSATDPKRISKRQKTKIIRAVRTEIGVPTKVTAGVMRSGAATPIDTRCGATVRFHGSTVPPTAKILAVLRCSHLVQLQSTNQKGKHAQTTQNQKKLGNQAAGQKIMISLQFLTKKEAHTTETTHCHKVQERKVQPPTTAIPPLDQITVRKDLAPFSTIC